MMFINISLDGCIYHPRHLPKKYCYTNTIRDHVEIITNGILFLDYKEYKLFPLPHDHEYSLEVVDYDFFLF
jgi:hypothetical protein